MRKPGLLLRFLLIAFFSFFLNTHIWAQPELDDDPGGGTDPGNDPDLPIDSNVFVLVAAGVGYGLKKRYELKQGLNRKREDQQNNVVKYEDSLK